MGHYASEMNESMSGMPPRDQIMQSWSERQIREMIRQEIDKYHEREVENKYYENMGDDL